MPKRCPKCKTLNSGSAVRCANPDCDHQFSPDSTLVTQPPAVVPPAVVPPPATDPQAQIAQRDDELAELRTLVDRLDKELAEQQEKLKPLVIEHRSSPSVGPSAASTVKTSAWMAPVLGFVAQWPR